jgi:hypothetical protein
MRLLTLALPILLSGAPLAAEPISFEGWSEQRFSLFQKVDYGFSSSRLSVSSDDSASMAYRRLSAQFWDVRSANWSWAVSEGVPATDLTLKGGDDRNLSLYFVFMPEAEAQRIGDGGSIRSLLDNEQARVLVYVWGGAHRRGDVLASPYLGPRGKRSSAARRGLDRSVKALILPMIMRRHLAARRAHLSGWRYLQIAMTQIPPFAAKSAASRSTRPFASQRPPPPSSRSLRRGSNP